MFGKSIPFPSPLHRSTEFSRRRFIFLASTAAFHSCRSANGGGGASSEEELYVARPLTPPGQFTAGIEGPACDAAGSLYAVNYQRNGTIGKVTPAGQTSLFAELPGGSVGNGIRFDSKGNMLVADYVNHNVLRIDRGSREVHVFAHEDAMNQPNDLAIGANDLVYASDPDWERSTGQLWRIDADATVSLLESGMGTTNGIEVGPDEKTLYVNESVQRRVWVYDLSAEGRISDKRLLIEFPDFGMDGMRCDVDGNLYITRYDKGTVVKISPRGEEMLEVKLGGLKPSNLAFGGPDGCTCCVTLADRGNIETFRVERPGRSWRLHQRRRSNSRDAKWNS